MEHFFLTDSDHLFPTWQEAFPQARFASPKLIQSCQRGTLWLRSTQVTGLNSEIQALRGLNGQLPLVVLADEPDEAGAFQAISLGAAGYCNSRAAPGVLQTIARVVHGGGLWLGQAMMRRLLAVLSARLDATNKMDGHFPAADAELAKLLLRGADHGEIAAALAIPEAAVGHSVSALYARAGVQDRLQLLLKTSQAA